MISSGTSLNFTVFRFPDASRITFLAQCTYSTDAIAVLTSTGPEDGQRS